FPTRGSSDLARLRRIARQEYETMDRSEIDDLAALREEIRRAGRVTRRSRRAMCLAFTLMALAASVATYRSGREALARVTPATLRATMERDPEYVWRADTPGRGGDEANPAERAR